MKLTFITTNKHKVEEGKAALKEFGIELEQLNKEYDENKEDSLHEVVKKAAKKLAAELNKPIIVEDTGVFFNAYEGFPGAMPKFVFNRIGYEGIFRLLEGKDRYGYFVSVIGYCEPGKEPLIFEGKCEGKFINKVKCKNKDVLPYCRIFVPKGQKKTTAEMTVEEKNKVSHRAIAFKKLGELLRG